MGPLWVLSLLLVANLTAAGTSSNSGSTGTSPNPGKSSARPLGPCQTCRVLVSSFENVCRPIPCRVSHNFINSNSDPLGFGTNCTIKYYTS